MLTLERSSYLYFFNARHLAKWLGLLHGSQANIHVHTSGEFWSVPLAVEYCSMLHSYLIEYASSLFP